MVDDITNIMLLQHMQGMKSDLQLQIAAVYQKITALEKKTGGVEKNMASMAEEMRNGFEEARMHRQSLQEDLEATMRMLSKHSTKLARLQA